MKSSKVKWLIGGIIILVSLASLWLLNVKGSVYFYTPAEAQSQASELAHKEIRVGGLVLPGSIKKNPETLDLEFVMSDLKGHEIKVHYRGAPPDMFKENQGVVVEGRITADGRTMQARNLYVKHSEEYKKPDDHNKMDTEYLKKSLFKDEKVNPDHEP